MPHNINALTNSFFIFLLNQVSVMINYQTNLTKEVFYKTSPYIFSHNIVALTNFFFFFSKKLSWWLIIKPTWTKNVSYRTSQYILSHNSNALTNCLVFLISYRTNLTKKYPTKPPLLYCPTLLMYKPIFFVFFSNKLPWRLIIKSSQRKKVFYKTS